MKKIIALLLAAAILGLAGCQATPEKGAVTSKNDGAFESALEAAPAPAAEGAGGAGGEYTDTFENASGSIRYELDLTAPAVETALPVLRVRPMEITSEMAERVARAIFGDGEIYEYSTQHTKSELEAAILACRESIADWDALVERCGGESEAEVYKSTQEERIAAMEQAYAQAPEAVDRALCDWQFHPGSYYSDVTHGQITDMGQQVLKASAAVDGIPFQYTVVNCDGGELREHYIMAGPDSEESGFGDAAYADRGAPGDPDALRQKALAIAEALDAGSWRVASDYEYAVFHNMPAEAPSITRVLLTRDWGGLAVTCHMGPSNEAAYGPQYPYEQLEITFNGDALVDFSYLSALEAVETVNENVQTLPFAHILAAAEEQMRRNGAADPLTGEMAPAPVDGSYERITVDGVQLGLTRIFIKDNTTEYYLVPTYTFYGTAVSCNADGTAMEDFTYTDETGRTITFPNKTAVELAVINAVDGSAIDVSKGY